MEAKDLNDWMPCSKLRRQPPEKKNRGRNFLRTSGRLLVLLLVVLAVGMVLRKVARPFGLCYTEARGVTDLSSELRRIQQENDGLSRKRTYLASEEGARIESRKLGWVMPGERSIVLQNTPGDDRSAPPFDEKPQGFEQRMKHWLKR
jgi:hypothetical protein